jgi:transposase
MLSLSSAVRVFVCRQATDMRSSFDRLAGIAAQVIKQDPVSGHLFLFLNRLRTSVKILYFDRTGWVIWYKRLERGTFSLPQKEEIDYRELMCVLEGIELASAHKKKRFFLRKNAA